mmetsp:Transcript_34596/g.40460  ORF Transcript_34596/g.40460 Transcript_34596/m.40460 type:complete len:167 (+) Transcript_34596:40-540(+)
MAEKLTTVLCFIFCLSVTRVASFKANKGDDTSCLPYPSCFLCTAREGCGWCPSSNACLRGNESGPLTSSCASWEFYSRDCVTPPEPPSPPQTKNTTSSPSPQPTIAPAPTPPTPVSSCSAYSNCYTCTEKSGCGFCGATSSCESGTSSGPMEGSCSDWLWNTLQCA